ncbi:hypothetical protein JHU04_000783 [Brenneria sp. 4F2]|nr:hypothetical protein [Brenneria bubanii]
MSFFTFKSKPLSSLPVNRYRWINIWTSILGHVLFPLPAVFGFNRPSLFVIGRFVREVTDDDNIFILLLLHHVGINGRRFAGRDVLY